MKERAMLERFIEAWADRDVAAVMDLMSQDCVFRSSIGPEPGTTFTGAEEVGAAFARLLDPGNPPAGITEDLEIIACDTFGVVRWTARDASGGGQVVITRAVDVFEFAGGLITVKDTYRKVMGAAM